MCTAISRQLEGLKDDTKEKEVRFLILWMATTVLGSWRRRLIIDVLISFLLNLILTSCDVFIVSCGELKTRTTNDISLSRIHVDQKGQNQLENLHYEPIMEKFRNG